MKYIRFGNVMSWYEQDNPFIEIVNCKDCRHCKYIEDSDTYYCDRIYPRRITEPDGFCNHGEVEE